MADTKKVPIIEYVVTKVPKYEIVKEELKIPVLKEVPVEGISKKDLELLKAYGAELTNIYAKLEKLKNYKITEEEIRVKRAVFEDERIKRPIFQDETIRVKRYIEEEKRVTIPVLREVPLDGISKEDLQLIRDMVTATKELKAELEKVKNYKIKEEEFIIEKPIYKPKVVEIETEKVNFVIKDEVIETIEELLSNLRKKGLK